MRLVLPRFDFQLTKKGEYYSMFHILFIRFFLLFLKGYLFYISAMKNLWKPIQVNSL